ncbi:MAG: sugar phosphate isomerase/epimerase [Pirellulales bacterium]|nr:sugar phosphate isomerase/epimerase [Pirellulales bacterium]
MQIDLRQELPAADLSSTALRHIRKLLEDLNLRVGSTAFPTRRGYAEADDLERRLEATINSMHAASRLQSRVLLIALGSLPLPDDPHRATLVEALLALASQGNRLGVQLALQAPAVRPADVNALLNELPEGLIGVDLSPADLILHSQSPAAYAADVGPRVLHVFANDAVRGLGGPGGGDVVLGRGSANLPELLSVLEEREYRGWITIERRASREPVEDASNAVQFLRSL